MSTVVGTPLHLYKKEENLSFNWACRFGGKCGLQLQPHSSASGSSAGMCKLPVAAETLGLGDINSCSSVGMLQK